MCIRDSNSSSDSGGFLFKTGIFALLAGVAFWLFNQFGGKKTPEPTDNQPKTEVPVSPSASTENQSPTTNRPSQVPENILPASTTGEVVRHTYFALSYDEDHEQAEWVAYEITRERLNENWAARPNTFRPDPDCLLYTSPSPRDRTRSRMPSSA